MDVNKCNKCCSLGLSTNFIHSFNYYYLFTYFSLSFRIINIYYDSMLLVMRKRKRATGNHSISSIGTHVCYIDRKKIGASSSQTPLLRSGWQMKRKKNIDKKIKWINCGIACSDIFIYNF